MGARLCGSGRSYGAGGAPGGTPGPAAGAAGSEGCPQLEAPGDDVVPSVCALGDRHFVVAGTDGWLYLYEWRGPSLVGKFRAHRKAVNRLVPLGHDRFFSASADGTARLWDEAAFLSHGEDDGGAAPVPIQVFEGHGMSVSSLDVLGEQVEPAGSLFTGSRDCSVRLWDIGTGRQLFDHKILRNVVTAVRRLPAHSQAAVVQASEDLQLRLWDARAGLRPAAAARAGPNQLICLDVSDDGNFVACGSKGFSRENCEVKVFDLRAGLRELSAAPCADQTIEALRVCGADCCLIASKDGFIRRVALPEVSVLSERGPAAAAYTALGVCRRPAPRGPVALAAQSSAHGGVRLELLSWEDQSPTAEPALLAAAG